MCVLTGHDARPSYTRPASLHFPLLLQNVPVEYSVVLETRSLKQSLDVLFRYLLQTKESCKEWCAKNENEDEKTGRLSVVVNSYVKNG